MTQYAIPNLPEKKLTDPRGRALAGRDGQPLTESMATYLLELSATPAFVAGLAYKQAVPYTAAFVASIRHQVAEGPGRKFLLVDEDAHKRLLDVIEWPQLRAEVAVLHCYKEFLFALLNAKPHAEAVAAIGTQPVDVAAE